MANENMKTNMKAVYGIVKRGEGKKDFWTRIGVAFTNRDGSQTLKLDFLPTDGSTTIHIRDFEKEDRSEAPAGPLS